MNRLNGLRSQRSLFLLSAFALTIFSMDARGAHIADIRVNGATTGVGTTSPVIRQSMGFNLTAGPPVAANGNLGDILLSRNGNPLTQESGAGIVTPNTYTLLTYPTTVPVTTPSPDPRQAASYSGRYTSSTGNSFANAAWLALGHIVGTGGGEANFPVSLAYFPYSEGWYAGTVLGTGLPGMATEADGDPLMGNFDEVTITPSTTPAPNVYKIEIAGRDSAWSLNPADTANNRYNRGDGMLFVTDAANETSPNYAVTAPVEGGWEVSIYDQNNTFPDSISGPFNFVYLPFATPNLIGGIINDDGSVIQGVGDFQAFNAASFTTFSAGPANGSTGEYFLVFPDGNGGYYDETDGILMLTVSKDAPLGEVFGPDDNYLVYQPATAAIEGQIIPGFRVASHDLPGGGNQTTEFSFAFLRYDNPIEFVVPEPSTIVLALLAGLGLIGWKRRSN